MDNQAIPDEIAFMEGRSLSSAVGYYALKAQKALDLAPEENVDKKPIYKPFISEETSKVANTGVDPADQERNRELMDEMVVQQYKDVEVGIQRLRHSSLTNLVNTHRITFESEFKGEPTALSHTWQTVTGMQEHNSAHASYSPFFGTCKVNAPHPYAYDYDDNAIDSYLARDMHGANQAYNPLMAELYSYKVQHEIGHCLSDLNKQGSIGMELKKSADKLFHNYPDLKQKLIDSAEDKRKGSVVKDFIKLVEGSAREVFGDIYSSLQVQKEYYLKNKERIDAGKETGINPLLMSVRNFRYDDRYGDPEHANHFELGSLINALQKPGALEKLSKATDEEIYVTAYQMLNDTIDRRVSVILDDAIGEDKNPHAVNYFQSNYQNMGVKPLFDFKAENIKESVSEEEQTISLKR